MVEKMFLGIHYTYRRAIPVTLIKEYCWCPAIPWIVYNYGFEPDYTPSMIEGFEYRAKRRLDEVADRLGLPEPRRYEVFVLSRKLGVYGYIDIVAGSKRLTVVEVKAFKTKRWKHFEKQLIVYAAIVNSELGPVNKAILVLGKKTISIEIMDRDIAIAKKLIDEVRRAIESPEPPRVNHVKNKCLYCRYRRLCPVYST